MALETDIPRDVVRGAIKRGVRAGSIVTEAGPNRAILHRCAPSVPVCGSVRPDSQPTPHSVCAAAYRAARTHTSTDGDKAEDVRERL